MATFGGKLKFSPLAVPPTTALSDVYQKPMVDWLKTYAFEDGYKPVSYTHLEAEYLPFPPGKT